MALGEPKPIIAAFDFDETLITKDSLPDFLRFTFPLHIFILKTLIAAPMLIRFKLHRIANQVAKERLLTIFIGNMPLDRFNDLCANYRKRLNAITNPEALTRLQWHQQRGDKVIIISASPENWIKPWAAQYGVDDVIATQLEVDEKQRLTGNLATPNCHGDEKVRRFRASYPKRTTYTLYMYGDGKSDQAMFSYADKAFERTFSHNDP